eukprot:SAG22_NODE_6188_length_888_cov_1.281369_1_plen_63_part_10
MLPLPFHLRQCLSGRVDEQYYVGGHSDGAGTWTWTDGTPVNMDFLEAHAHTDAHGVGLAGTDE